MSINAKGKFQTDDKKIGAQNWDNYNPAFTSHVVAKTEEQMSIFEKNIDKWADLISFFRFYPDILLDLLKPKTGGINLHADQRVFLRAIVRFFSVYGVFPRGWGKCVTGDAKIFTDNGLKEIGSFFDYQSDNVETIKDTNFKIVDRYGKCEETDRGIYSGFKDTIKIETRDGFNIEGTYNHPLLVMNKDGEVEFRMLSEIEVGDYVCVSRNNNLWGNDLDVDKGNEIAEWRSGLSKQAIHMIPELKTPTIMDEDLAYFLGILIGDGCLTVNNLIIFSTIDSELENMFKKILKEKFDIENVNNYNNCDYRVQNASLKKYLQLIGLSYAGSHEKTVPDCVLSSPKEIVKSFLMGLFDTDGTVDDNIISYTSVSYELITTVQLLLLNIGIVSRVKYYKNKYKGSYLLTISGDDRCLFVENVGFRLSRKKEKTLKFLNKCQNTNLDIIPNQSKWAEKIAQQYPKLKEELYNCRVGANDLSYLKLGRIVAECDGNNDVLYSHFKELADCNYYYAKTVKKTFFKNNVYDIQVPSSHSFVANGIVSHNTFLEVIASFLCAMLFPGCQIALTAQTKQNASELLKAKYNEIVGYYPLIKNEIINPRFSINDAIVPFVNGSSVDILANAQTSKGQRRHRENVEESALLNNALFEDVLEPIVEVGRTTKGNLGINNPEELNQQINFFTTAGFRGSDEFIRSLNMLQNMRELKGDIVLGSDWMLACWYGRGSTKEQVLKRKARMSSTSFAQNYQSHWVGASDGQLVDINKLLNCRNLSNPLFINEDDGEFVLGIDVARSQKSSNNRSSVSVLKIVRNANNTVKELQLVNLVVISNASTFTAQSIEIKRMQKCYNAKIAIVDGNGLGAGLVDCLYQEQTDPLTGETLPAWNSTNTEQECEYDSTLDILYVLTPQSAQSRVITHFMDVIETAKLRMLEKRNDNEFGLSADGVAQYVPYAQTDEVISEISNLKLKHLNNGNLAIEKVVLKVDKDRFSSLAYAIWWIMEFDNKIDDNKKVSMVDYFRMVNGNTQGINLTKKYFR